MRRHRPAGYHGDHLPGPGDFTPPDPDELDEFYVDKARARLELKARDGHLDPEDITDTAVLALAWRLQEQDRQPPDDLGLD